MDHGDQQPQETIGAHARITYAQVRAAGAPQDPVSPDEHQARIYRGERRKRVRVVKAAPTTTNSIETRRRDEFVYLIRSDENDNNVQQAYRRLPKREKKTIILEREGGWGHIVFATVLPRVVTNDKKDNGLLLFQEPTPGEEQHVAIKKLKKKKVHRYLNRGGKENPYRNIQRMQQIGDNVHVIECMEALQDEKYLYIVMPLCGGRGSLWDAIRPTEQPNEGFSEMDALPMFCQILQNLHYLQSHGISHHDLSPDNMMFYQGRLVFIDFAMSVQVPHHGDNDRRLLMKPQGVFGKPPYMAPEVFSNQGPFDGYSIDLWGAATTLYNLLTTHHICYIPHPRDPLFRYFIMAGGLSNEPLNERTIEILMETSRPGGNINDYEAIMTRAMAQLNMSWQVTDLLHNMLKLNPADRYTLAQVMESSWVQNQ